MRTIRKLGWSYLKCVDATIRVLGTYCIMALLTGVVVLLLLCFNWLCFGRFSSGPFDLWVVVPCLPPIVKLSVLGGGFTIPPLFKRKPAGEEP